MKVKIIKNSNELDSSITSTGGLIFTAPWIKTEMVEKWYDTKIYPPKNDYSYEDYYVSIDYEDGTEPIYVYLYSSYRLWRVGGRRIDASKLASHKDEFIKCMIDLYEEPSESNNVEERSSFPTEVTVEKITDIELAKEFLEITVHDKEFKSSLKKLDRLYMSEHSPMYSQVFIIRMKDVYSYVTTHFRTHKKNFICEQVTTNRPDRGGDSDAGRYSLVDMMIMCNAKTLVDMSLKRLCTKADINTRRVMNMIKDEVKKVDESLYRFMVPQCVYRCGLCQEFKSCGYINSEGFKGDLKNYLKGFEDKFLFSDIIKSW